MTTAADAAAGAKALADDASRLRALADQTAAKPGVDQLREAQMKELDHLLVAAGYRDLSPITAQEPPPLPPAPQNAPGWFKSAVTNDLHLTVSGIIVFACILGSIWYPIKKDQFAATAAAAGLYLTGRATKNGDGNGNGH